jgi:hypothetical protein
MMKSRSIRSKTSALIVLLLVARAAGQVAPAATGRYVVTTSPLSIFNSGPTLCIGVDPTDPRGIWWWEPGQSGCSSRSTVPDVFSAYEGAVAVASDRTTIDAHFKLGMHVGEPLDIRLTIRDGRMFVTGSDVPDTGADVANFGVPVARSDDLVLPFGSLTHSGSAQDAINARQNWGPAVNGVRMAVALVKPGPVPQQGAELDVMFQNVGDTELMLELGVRDNWTRSFYPIRLDLTNPSGRSMQASFMDGQHPSFTGRLDDLTVSVPAGATHVLRLNLEKYGVALSVGHNRIATYFEGVGPQLLHSQPPQAGRRFWIGTLQSGSLDVDVAP